MFHSSSCPDTLGFLTLRSCPDTLGFLTSETWRGVTELVSPVILGLDPLRIRSRNQWTVLTVVTGPTSPTFVRGRSETKSRYPQLTKHGGPRGTTLRHWDRVLLTFRPVSSSRDIKVLTSEWLTNHSLVLLSTLGKALLINGTVCLDKSGVGRPHVGGQLNFTFGKHRVTVLLLYISNESEKKQPHK